MLARGLGECDGVGQHLVVDLDGPNELPGLPWNWCGFWVATTKKGSGRGRVSPSTVTCPSAIASSSALCVRGVARLISSASNTGAKTGPGIHEKRASLGS